MPVEESPSAAPATGRQVRAFGGYLVGFDGLRGFTIFCVLFYHARLGPYEGFYLSLSLFFVLSGFLITAILLDDRARTGRVDFKRFWARRPESQLIGSSAFDSYLTQEYLGVAETLTATGAKVVWMQAPCIDRGSANDPGAVNTEWVDGRELGILNDEILPAVAASYPGDVTLYDLDAVLCPDGRPLREVDGISPIRGDGVHSNVEGSGWFAETHGSAILELGGLSR